MCLGAGSNRRPLPLQGNALPTELPKQWSLLYLFIDIFQPPCQPSPQTFSAHRKDAIILPEHSLV